MKALVFTLARQLGITVAFFTLIIQVQAQTVFSDSFDSSPSPLWGNEAGAWSATQGAYGATEPGNFPSAFSSLPFNLTNFSVSVDVNGVTDGGIWLRSSAVPGTGLGIKGVLLVVSHTSPANEGQIYWHVVTDGSEYGDPLNVKVGAFEVGSNLHLRVTVSGSTYSAFIDDSKAATTTLTTAAFASGRVALYANSNQSFDNFGLQVLGVGPNATIPSVVLPAVEVRWNSELGRWYQVQWAQRLRRASWADVGAPQQGTGSVMSFFDTARTPEKGYFRVQLLP